MPSEAYGKHAMGPWWEHFVVQSWACHSFMSYVGVHFSVCFLLWGSHVADAKFNQWGWGLTIQICITATLWSMLGWHICLLVVFSGIYPEYTDWLLLQLLWVGGLNFTHSAFPQPFHQYGGDYSFVGLEESPDTSVFPRRWGSSFPGHVPLNDMADSKSLTGIKPGNCGVVIGYQVDGFTCTWSAEHFTVWMHIHGKGVNTNQLINWARVWGLLLYILRPCNMPNASFDVSISPCCTAQAFTCKHDWSQDGVFWSCIIWASCTISSLQQGSANSYHGCLSFKVQGLVSS